MERPDGGSVTDAAEREPDHDGERARRSRPAPPDADVRGPAVVCRLSERECDHRRAGDTPPTLRLQPWTPRGAAATYVAWAVDDCGGHFGVFDPESERLLLGEGSSAGRRWRPLVETGPASAILDTATPELRPSVPRATATTTDGAAADPKPADATAAGPTRTLALRSWSRPVTAFVQAWRPLNAGAVYVACRVDDAHDRFSYHGWFGTLHEGVLRLGRRPAPAFVAVDLGEVAAALDVDVAALVPDRTAPRVVSDVLHVERGSERQA
jgi:hypothetical protein